MPPRYRSADISSSPEVYNQCDPMELDPSEKKVLKNTVFPPDFNKKVDTKKVNLEVLKQYVTRLARDHRYSSTY